MLPCKRDELSERILSRCIPSNQVLADAVGNLGAKC